MKETNHIAPETMKSYKATLGSQQHGYYMDWFKSLDELREWANGLIEKYNLSGATLKIQTGRKGNDSYIYDSEAAQEKVIEIK